MVVALKILNIAKIVTGGDVIRPSPKDLEVRLRANGIERLVLELKPENPKPEREEALA